MNEFITILGFIPILLITIVIVRLHPSGRAKRRLRLMSKLPENQLEPLEPYVGLVERMAIQDKAFVAASGGIKGSLGRIRLADVYLLLTWDEFVARKLSVPDASYIWSWSTMQLFFTLLQLPEAALCSVVKPLPHFMAYMAFISHRKVVLRCQVAFEASGPSDGSPNIHSLL